MKSTAWPNLKRQNFLKDVVSMKASITTIADLNCLPPSTGMQWAREAGLMKGRPKYTRGPMSGKKSATDQENQQIQNLLTAWRCSDEIKEWLDKKRRAEQEAQADKVRWEYER